MEVEIFRLILEKSSNIKFHELGAKWLRADKRSEWHDKADGRFS